MAWAGNKWGVPAWGSGAWGGTQWGVTSGNTPPPPPPPPTGLLLTAYTTERFTYNFPNSSAATEATRSAMGATLSGSAKWMGGVLGPDGKIYGIPYNATDILIIDPVAGTATRSAMGATLSGSYKWIGGVLGPDGKIYGIPYSAADILKILTAGTLPSNVLLSANLNKM